jgi:hypothetical protein
MTLTHDIDVRMDWCRRCGRPMIELVEADMPICDGLPGVIHKRFIEAEKAATAIFDPIVKSITGNPEGNAK